MSWRRRASLPDGWASGRSGRKAWPFEPALADSFRAASVVDSKTAKGLLSPDTEVLCKGWLDLVGRWTGTSACEGILSVGGGEGWCAGRRAGTREQEDGLLQESGFVSMAVDGGGHGKRIESNLPLLSLLFGRLAGLMTPSGLVSRSSRARLHFGLVCDHAFRLCR